MKRFDELPGLGTTRCWPRPMMYPEEALCGSCPLGKAGTSGGTGHRHHPNGGRASGWLQPFCYCDPLGWENPPDGAIFPPDGATPPPGDRQGFKSTWADRKTNLKEEGGERI